MAWRSVPFLGSTINYPSTPNNPPSQPYNPLIASTFYRAGYIESWGRGIAKIQRDCRKHGIESPEYDFETAGLTVTLRANREHLAGEEKTSEKRLAKTAREIVALIRENRNITTLEIAEKLGVSRRAIEMQIEKLKHLQIVQRIGPDKGGHWEVTE